MTASSQSPLPAGIRLGHGAMQALHMQALRRSLSVWQLLPVLSLVALAFLLPLLLALAQSVDGWALDLHRYGAILRDPVYRSVLLRTFETGAIVTLACLLLGYPLAYLLTVLPRRLVAVLLLCLLVPLFTAFLIRTYGWMSLLGRQGAINMVLLALDLSERPLRLLGTRFAVLVGMVHVLLPIAVFTLYANLMRIDLRLLAAAEVLGARPWQAFLRIYLPLSLPGLLAAAMLVFIMAIGFFITPVLLGGPADTMLAQLIVTHVTSLGQPESGYALAALLLLATCIVLAGCNLVLPLEQIWTSSLAPSTRAVSDVSAISRGRLWFAALGRRGRGYALAGLEGAGRICGSLAWLRRPLLYGHAVLMVMFLLAPLAVVYLLSFSAAPYLVFPPQGFSLQWYERFFESPAWRESLVMSLKLAVVVASLATCMAALAAFALVRGLFAFKRLVLLAILTPLLVPVVIVALCLYVAAAISGLLGSFAGLVLGHLVLATPYSLIILLGVVRSLDRNLEYAAATLGATPVMVLRRVTLPQMIPGLLTAWLMAFLQSFDELLIAMFLLGRQPQTLPLKMWSDIRMQFDPVTSAASSSIITAVALVIVVAQLRRRKPAGRASGPEVQETTMGPPPGPATIAST